METALGGLQWDPDTFWNATITEYTYAIAGRNRANGNDKPKPPSGDDVDALVKRYGGLK